MKDIENTQKLKADITRTIDNTQMPKEIEEKIEELLRKYENIIFSCIDRLRVIETKNNLEQIMNIRHYIKKDFEENEESINSISKDAYIVKKEEMLNRIISKIETIEQRDNKNTVLSVVLFDSNEEKSRYNKGIIEIEDKNGDRESNNFFLNTIKENIISEFKFSRSGILQKIKEIKIEEEDIEGRELKEHLQERTIRIFEEEIERIIQIINTEIPELGKIIQAQDNQIYEEIKRVLKENGIEISEEKTNEEKHRNFIQKLSEGVEVSEEKALEKVEEQREENSEKIKLDENIIS